MNQYKVTGMSCAACQSRVEKAVSKVPGVTTCSVSLLTNSMGVEGTANPADIISAVKKAGYGAQPLGASSAASATSSIAEQESLLQDTTSPVLKKRLCSSLILLLALMYVSMGHNMLGLPLPHFFDGNYIALALVQMILAAVIMLINKKFFVSGFSAVLHGGSNMDTLVALGSGTSFVYSTVMLFGMTDAVLHNNGQVRMFAANLYYESAAMIVTLITLGKLLESISKGHTTDALKSLMELTPKTATVLRDGKEVTIPAEEVRVGDFFTVRPGQSFAVDGIVTEGTSAVNESALTGESIPVDKSAGDRVSAATINESGFLTVRATRVGSDTTLSQIIKMVGDAAATKAPIAKVADKVSAVFVPSVIAAAVLTFIIWLLVGKEFGFALSRAISVLVVSCPCALGLATPVAIMVGSGLGAKNGILFKTSAALEETARIQVVALDKTGTITNGKPVVTAVVPASGVSEQELLQTALALESKSEHPLAKAVTEYPAVKSLVADQSQDVTDFAALPGNGLTAKQGGTELAGGNADFIATKCGGDAQFKSIETKAQELSRQGNTPLFFAKGGTLLGLIAVADSIKSESAAAIALLKSLGLYTVMLTGDNERTAKAVAREAGVDDVIAGVLPGGKADVIRQLKVRGKVAMVGDGINDAPALTNADVGIAIGAGADVALDAADVVLVNSRLSDVVAGIRLGRAVLRGIHQNLFWAFIYNIILIPVAAGVWYKAFGLKMNPMFGAAAMSCSSFTVCMNALRLNFIDLRSSRHDKKIKQHNKEKSMFGMSKEVTEKTVKVEGMMCTNCERHVKEALEKVSGIKEAVASHEKGEVLLKCTKDVDSAKIQAAVEKAGYKFVG